MRQAILFKHPARRTEPSSPSPTSPSPSSTLPSPSSTLHSLLADLPLVTARDLARDARRRHQPTRLTNIPAIDTLLEGLPRGALTEINGSRSSGRMALVTSALAAWTSTGENVALVDHGDQLDPASAENGGVDLTRMLWVRPGSVADAVHATEILLTTGFPLVVLDLGLRLRGRRPNDGAWLRLQRTAASHDASLLVSSPWPVSGIASTAVLNVSHGRGVWRRGAKISLLEGVTTSLTTTRRRNGRPGESAGISLTDGETIPRPRGIR